MRSLMLFALVACGSAEVKSETTAPTTSEIDQAQWKTFGEEFTLTSAIPVQEALSKGETLDGKTVRVTGELSQVCQKAGCWAVVSDSKGNSARVTMKDHKFGIDKDTVGRACDIEGTLVRKAVDLEKVAHFKSEGASGAQPEDGKTHHYELVASSVAIRRAK